MAGTWCVPAVLCASSIRTRPSAATFLRPGPLLSDVEVQKGTAVPGGHLCTSFLFVLEFLTQPPHFLHFLLFFLCSWRRSRHNGAGCCPWSTAPSIRALLLLASQGFCSVNCVVAPNRAFVLRFRLRQVLSVLEAEGFYLFN